MNMNKFQFFRRLTAVVMVSSVLMTSALAVEYDISQGNVTVKGGEDGSVSSWQDGGNTGYTAESPSTDKNITISGKSDTNTVTLDSATVNNSDTDNAGLTINEGADVVVELKGNNTLTGGNGKAGLNVGEGASVTIKDGESGEDTNGSLTATGTNGGAGIGGNYQQNAGSITIEGGNITAEGGSSTDPFDSTNRSAAGIGGGGQGSATEINITGGTVIANAGENDSGYVNGGAGIGGGTQSYNSQNGGGGGGNINITGNATVNATGSVGGAGIGSGWQSVPDTSASTGTNITIGGDANVTATGHGGGAGIGGGYGSAIGSIEISGDAFITAESLSTLSPGGAGIGSGNGLYGASDNNTVITIKENATVTATGGESSAGIGGGQYYDGGTINISTTGKVTAQGGSKTYYLPPDPNSALNYIGGAGIGGGAGGGSGTITIDNATNVTATGGKGGAGIGSGGDFWLNLQKGLITIQNGSIVNAQGGDGAAGVGSGAGNGVNVNSITIKDSDVTATGGKYGAGIGAGWASKFGQILIESGHITATSGVYASGIGNGCNDNGGTITIADGVNLMAYGDQYFAIDLRASNSFASTILNGRFADATLVPNTTYHIVSVDENGKEQVIFPMTMTTDGNGKLTIGTTDNLQMVKNGNLFESFAISGLEAGKTYYIRPVDNDEFTTYSKVDTKENGSFDKLGADRQLGYQTENADQIKFSVYDVTYEFQAAEGTTQPLPDNLPALPGISSGNKVTEVNPQVTISETYPDVSIPGGTWSFDGWTTAAVVTDNTVADTVRLIGTWTFTPSSGGSGGSSKPDPTPEPDPDPDPEPNPDPDIDIPEEDPPLADIPEEDPPLTDIPEEDPPLADIPEEDPPLAEAPDKQPSPKPSSEKSSLVEISDEAVPLADVPKTGDLPLGWYSAFLLSACGLTALVLLKKRERDA